MARRKAENGQELPDMGSSGTEEMAAEVAAPEAEKTQAEAAAPDLEQLSANEVASDVEKLSEGTGAATGTEEPSAEADAVTEQPASGEKKDTWYRVTTKNPVTKKIGPIQFVEGKALVPSSERWMLTWFKEHGYRIEKAE